MKTVKVPGLELKVDPKSTAFRCTTPTFMPQAHFLLGAIGRRGQGKTQYVTSFLEKLECVDRLFLISPSARSNKQLVDRLKNMLSEEDIYHNVDDVGILDDIVKKVEQERDDLEEYWEKKKRYDRLMKVIDSQNPLFHLSDDDLLSAYEGGRFQPPKHRWGGRIPMLVAFFDDVVSTPITLGKGARQMTKLALTHRHLGQFEKGGAVGLSMIWAAQSYRTAQGGIPKAIRNNLTLILIFKTKSERELVEIAEEAAGQVDRETFFRIYKAAIREPHDALLIDLNPKKEHMYN